MAAVAAGLLLPLFLLGGCGSDTGTAADSTETTKSAPGIVSRQKFIDETHKLCVKWKNNINHGLGDLYEQRSKETGEPAGAVGAIEAMRVVIVPMYKQELEEMEAVGLPKGDAYAAEEVWESIRWITHKIENEGIFAWTRESLLFAYRERAKQFQLQNCLYF